MHSQRMRFACTDPRSGAESRMPNLPRVVLDTGIVLQAVLRPQGPAGRVVSLIDQGIFEICLSDDGLTEYFDVLHRPSIRAKNPRLTDSLASAILERLVRHGSLIPNVPSHLQYSRDPGDEHILNLAFECNARYVVSRDKYLLDLMTDDVFRRSWPGLMLVTPEEFVHAIGGSRSSAESAD